MATIKVTAATDAGKGVSLAEAIQLAMSTPEADSIVFAKTLAATEGIHLVRLPDTAVIRASGGELTIDGDIDHDGVADVVIDTNDRHFDIQSGAKLVLTGLDLIGGYARGDDGVDGAEGTPGSAAKDATGNVGMDGKDGTAQAGDGTDAEDGAAGEEVGGSIENHGDLTLIRVGFGGNIAYGGNAGNGGEGGDGGLGARGSDGLTDEILGHYPSREVGLDTEHTPRFVNDETVPVAGGDGGDGGPGGNAGDGGEGGEGGDAGGAILNAEGGSLTMVDVSFGGRLVSGAIFAANSAFAGDGGAGGNGGTGGDGGTGGLGGDYGREWSSVELLNWGDWDDPDAFAIDYHILWVATAPAGEGGDGGMPGLPGDGGDGGDGGDAATVLNHGTIKGSAAFTGNEAEKGGLSVYGAGREGGTLFGTEGWGGFERATWAQWTGLTTYKSGTTDSEAFNAWFDSYDSWVLSYYSSEHPDPTERAASGDRTYSDITGEDGETGEKGTEHTGLYNDGGSGAVNSSASLVYLYDLGQDGDTLSFNIIRVGATNKDLTIGWQITGGGKGGVSAADFVGGLPSGEVTLTKVANVDGGVIDRSANVAHVEVKIAGDTLSEGLEKYRIQLLDPSVSSVVLGTSSVTGTIDDSGIASPEINGNGKANHLKGTSGDDVMNGRGGRDTLLGLAGNDILNGDDGNDVLNGGKGKDLLNGGRGADDLYGGDAADDFAFNGLSDSTVSQKGRDTIFDFSHGQGDQIVLSAIDANSKVKGDQAFDFIGQAAFSETAGELRFVKKASDTYVYGDVDGDGKADFAIHFAGALALHAGDFVL